MDTMENKTYLGLLKLKPRFFGLPAHSLLSIPTKLSAILRTQGINRNYKNMNILTAPIPNIIEIRPVFSYVKHEDGRTGQFCSVGNISSLILEVPGPNL
jgi:hypothetical protein